MMPAKTILKGGRAKGRVASLVDGKPNEGLVRALMLNCLSRKHVTGFTPVVPEKRVSTWDFDDESDAEVGPMSEPM